MQTFPAYWCRVTPLSLALWPLSVLYGVAVAARQVLYRHRLLSRTDLGVPVIVLGNLFIGGTGKTPLALALAKDLLQAGYRPGILCSGYGGRRRDSAEVHADGDPRDAGDEAVLLARSSGCPVWSGRNRVASAMGLLSVHPSCDVLLCDDGLQHYALMRELEIEVVDNRGHGNGLLLPAGPLREPSSRAVDARVFNVAENASISSPGGPDAPAFRMTLQPSRLYRLDRPGERIDPAAIRAKRLHAVAGTGNPQRFFDTLSALGLQAVPHAFPDHHDFRPEDLAFPGCDAIVMTEKDAVKCRRFNRVDLYAVQVEANVDSAFFEFVRSRLAATVLSRTAGTNAASKGPY